MFKKFNFIISALFAPFVFADMHMPAGGEVNHMSDMMSDSSVEDSGFWGSVELKYTHKEETPATAPASAEAGTDGDTPVASGKLGESMPSPQTGASYRARVGWKGDVNETIKWGVSVSSAIEGQFQTPSLRDVHVEQAYVAYSPVEGFTLKAGKYGWKAKFHKTGVLYDDDIYTEGVYAKYYYGERDSTNAYVKAIVYNNNYTGSTYSAGWVTAAKAGGAYEVAEGMALGAYVSVENNAINQNDNATKKTLAKAGVHFNADLGVPAGAFAVYATDVKAPGFDSYTGGVYVGNAGSNCSKNSEAHDFGVAVSYYDVQADNFNTALLDTDYAVAGGNAKGVAARAQYNLWDNANAVVKYAYDLNTSGSNAHTVVGEATFNF